MSSKIKVDFLETLSGSGTLTSNNSISVTGNINFTGVSAKWNSILLLYHHKLMLREVHT
jgi:hypothetical protein